ncbi:BTB/POZ and MATH domain-containing protein 2 [Panicum miliaceum]|uniref:BTB/POZ and MATH domain-containing protein 2 n=1 Tax=Panicum miliaceum TaxID=4540 RepID=A0A3L6Q3M9_PANMI|nr:BTB/POZ and MATH domain-containing protein 2 [Panicum miliaceum]
MVDKDGRVSKLPMLGDDRPLIHTFGPEDREWIWGIPCFIEKYKLRHFLFLNDDSLTIRCVLTVFKSRTEDVNTTIISVLPANLHRDLEHMLKDGKGVDATFDVDGHLFHAHRWVQTSQRKLPFDRRGDFREDCHIQEEDDEYAASLVMQE